MLLADAHPKAPATEDPAGPLIAEEGIVDLVAGGDDVDVVSRADGGAGSRRHNAAGDVDVLALYFTLSRERTSDGQAVINSILINTIAVGDGNNRSLSTRMREILERNTS